ncbi:MAG: efflux RND transporter periplasmic adaptor subunit [Bacteroidales bacterium]|nr:efflux RND transporter periplasmic adaptor subunit [Bacteroidales bacterium]
MRNIIIILAVLFLASCAGKKADETPEQEIRAYQKQISDINQKIAVIEQNNVETEINTEDLLLVKTVSIKKTTFSHTITVSGAIDAIKFAAINPEMPGRITKIAVSEGQVVQKGTVLAQLDDRLLQSQLKQTKIGLEMAQTMFDRQNELWEKKIGTEIQFLQAKNQKDALENQIQTLKVQISMTKLIAPFSGIVDRIYQKEGELANPAIKLFDFVNLNQLYVNAEVSEDYISNIKRGDKATIMFPAFPNLEIKTSVYRTSNIINPSSRSFLTRFKISNINNKIKPNLIANVLLSDYTSNNSIAISSIVIQSDLEGKYIFIADKKDNFYQVRKQYLKTGLNEGGKTEILSGLVIGDLVITEGYNLVRKGQNIKIVQ